MVLQCKFEEIGLFIYASAILNPDGCKLATGTEQTPPRGTWEAGARQRFQTKLRAEVEKAPGRWGVGGEAREPDLGGAG